MDIRLLTKGEREMDLVGLIISLISGAVGGNIAGALMKDKSLGTLWNSVAGIVGGGIGGQILAALGLFGGAAADAGAEAAGGFSVGGLIANIAGSGVGGAILLAIVGWIRSVMAK
jgi:uncharacterized membrane protein YeaQ/YmgE (transglycosylase-associated protein family)